MAAIFLSKIDRINYLIRIKATGTPLHLSKKLGISERTLYNYINFMKSKGAPICYCKTRRSYYYEDDGNFVLTFHRK